MDLITGHGPFKRHEIIYFAEATLGAVRINVYKYRFIDQPGGWLGGTVKSDFPMLTNIRLDPFERIQPDVGQHRKVRFDRAAQPASWLVDEAILVNVYADGAKRCFGEVDDLVALEWSVTRDQVHLVVTIEMYLVLSF